MAADLHSVRQRVLQSSCGPLEVDPWCDAPAQATPRKACLCPIAAQQKRPPALTSPLFDLTDRSFMHCNSNIDEVK